MPDPRISRRRLTIEWGDCDPADIVYFPNYFRWFDASTAHHFKAVGLPKPELLRRYDVVGFPMVDTNAQFHAPSRHGDTVEIETRLTEFGRSSFTVRHQLYRDDKLCVEGAEKRVLVKRAADGDGIVPFPVPPEVQALFFVS